MVSEELRPYDGCVLPPQASEIEELHDWSLNYSPLNNPYCIFLDLIGYSEERYGTCVGPSNTKYYEILGYKELCMLANALNIFEDNGYDQVYAWCDALNESEDSQ